MITGAHCLHRWPLPVDLADRRCDVRRGYCCNAMDRGGTGYGRKRSAFMNRRKPDAGDMHILSRRSPDERNCRFSGHGSGGVFTKQPKQYPPGARCRTGCDGVIVARVMQRPVAAACARPVTAGHLYFRDRRYPHGQWLRQAMPLSLHGGQQAGSGPGAETESDKTA